MRISAAICALCLLFSLPAFAAQEEKPCDPIAKFFGETICRDAFREESPEIMDAMKVPEEKRPQLKKQMTEHNRSQMLDLLWRKALIQKFGEDAITPTPTEVEKFKSGFANTMKTSYEADKKTVAYLKEALEKNKFEEAAQTQMQDIVKAAETGIKLYEEREKQIATLPESYKFLTASAETEVARSLLKHWKEDKILFDIYGGRLIMGMNSPLPVDAYMKFMAYIDEKGTFEAIDPAYADIFAEIKGKDAAGAETLPADSDIYKNYFSDPTWQLNLSNSNSRLEDLKKWVEGLPRK